MKKNKKEKITNYFKEFQKYKKLVNNLSISSCYEHTIETSFESLKDWSLFYNIDEVKDWFIKKKKNLKIEIKEIDIKEMRKWKVEEKSGNIMHETNDFFLIRGLSINVSTRESECGWDQPIVEQIGYDGGILGIIRKRFSGIPHYLCEAKFEPGNYGLLQLSPTLQATFSNLKRKHNGRKPFFSDYFENIAETSDIEILYDSWLAEDGGRLYKKRNRAMLIEIPETHEISLPNDNFFWLSLYQIKQLLRENSWINPHIRGIIAHT
jgi:oxidase EvaA